METIKNLIWNWSDFHLKKWQSPIKIKKSIKTVKIGNSKKKNKTPSRAIALRDMCTKFGAHWNIFRYKNGDRTESITESQTHRITDT